MNIWKIWAAIVVGFAALSMRAAEHDLESRNYFYLGGRLHFNVSAQMRNVPQPANTGPDYDDGFVRDDISNSAGGKSWNWGYNKTNQLFGASPNRELELHGAPSPRDGSTDRLSGDTQYGFELGYGREFWRFGNEDRPIRVGFEGSFSASALSVDMRNTVGGMVIRVSDRYALGAVVPPNPPYSGSFEGPAPPNPPTPLIGTNIISRTTSVESATSTQTAEITGTYWGFRLGPFVEVPLPRRFSVQSSAGLALIHVDAKLSYEERFTITGLGGPPPTRVDTGANDDILVGFYLNARVNYWLNDFVAIYLGGELQALDDFKLNALNREARLDFGSTFGVVVGVMYAF
jgi:hypothetical protein